MAIPSSITRFGKYEPWHLQVSRQQVENHKRLFKFGFNPDINGTEETVWDAGGIYVYPSAAVAMTATTDAGTPADDNGVKILIQGLDANYNEVSQEVTLAGVGTATTTQTFIRVFRAYVSGSQAPTGTINITNGGTTYARVSLGDNQTLMSMWTVPAGYTAYLSHLNIASGTPTGGQYMLVKLVAREFGGVFRTQLKQSIGSNGVADFVIEYPLSFLEKTDIEVRASGSGANNLVSSDFTIIYIKNTSA